jgi:anti-sigma factor RsiW
MRDMTRDEMQDLLPELLHGRLTADVAAELGRAVAADPSLAAELAMLRAVQASHSRMPALDLSRIVSALPSPPATQGDTLPVDELAARRTARRPLISYRFARAAALLVVVGGGTMISVWSGRTRATVPGAEPVRAESVAVAAGSMQLRLGASTDELSVEQLRALEEDIRALDGIPAAEPDVTADFLAGEGA